MRVHLVDPSGQALGLALGLAEAGHRVDYASPLAWRTDRQEGFTPAIAQLAQHRCGAPAGFAELPSTDLLVLVDCFADRSADLMAVRHLQPEPPTNAWDTTLDPRVYPLRLAAYLRLATAAARVVVLDTSDLAGPRETALEGLPHATLLAREVPVPVAGVPETGPWQPFPYLYNPTLLVLERARDAANWWRPLAARRTGPDWAFCGTIDHPRYGTRRARALDAIRRRWPELRGDVATGRSFFDALQHLQAARCALDLPGAGRLCFRLHEALALGIPVFAPRMPAMGASTRMDAPPEIVLPAGLAAVRVDDPYVAAAVPTELVLTTYRDRYAPMVAAEQLVTAAMHADAPRETVSAH